MIDTSNDSLYRESIDFGLQEKYNEYNLLINKLYSL